jgi:hypothetical protein
MSSPGSKLLNAAHERNPAVKKLLLESVAADLDRDTRIPFGSPGTAARLFRLDAIERAQKGGER